MAENPLLEALARVRAQGHRVLNADITEGMGRRFVTFHLDGGARLSVRADMPPADFARLWHEMMDALGPLQGGIDEGHRDPPARG